MNRHPFFRALVALTLLGTALLAAGFFPGGGSSAYAIAAPYAPDEVVVRLSPGITGTIDAINADYGTTTIRALQSLPDTYLLATPPGEDAATTITRLRGDMRLSFVEPNYLSGAPEASPRKIGAWGGLNTAPRFDQYALSRINLYDAFDHTRGAGVTVAVIDTGFQMDHPALSGSLLPTGYDFVDGDTDPTDVATGVDTNGDGFVDGAFGHGSHVAGIVLLVAPQARILPIRALDSDGVGEIYTVAMAIEYAVKHGANVINLSLGTDLHTELLSTVVRAAAQQGVLVVAAAGNTGLSDPEYPAADPCAVGVTSIDRDNRLAPDATFGPWVDLAAPGESIYSPMYDNGYGWWSGTSMATPFVSGQAALLFAERPDLGLRQMTGLMVATGQGIDNSGTSSYPTRLINVGNSVDVADSGRYFSGRLSFMPTECTAPLVTVEAASTEPQPIPAPTP